VAPPAPQKRRWLRLTLIISAGVLTLCCIGSVALASIFPSSKDQNSNSNSNAIGGDVHAAGDHGGTPTTAPVNPARPAATSTPTLTAPPTIAAPTTTRPVTSTHTTTKPPTTTKTTTKPPPNLCGAPSNPWGYNFCGGSAILTPAASFCSYFKCIANFPNGKGYVEECKDGMYSKSGGIQGSCSQHGGNLAELFEP
jgi:hypothetical protein